MPPFDPSSSVLYILGDVALAVTALAVLTFTALYAIRSDWRANIVGRALMYAMGCFSLVLLLVFVSRLLGPDYLGREIIRLVVYVLTATAMTWLVTVLVRIQNRERHSAELPDRKTERVS